jgi:hypothetical protein
MVTMAHARRALHRPPGTDCNNAFNYTALRMKTRVIISDTLTTYDSRA